MERWKGPRFSPQQGDLRLSGQGVSGWPRGRDRMIPADLRADSLVTALATHSSSSPTFDILKMNKATGLPSYNQN
ncbi:hypothetical protein PoB_004519600 [Plakobranchus ocellatus]|uniref:Uncharacterized protein n=1 Tax=Plakobranchus ocellatus TaxID=259542 RepID=A0AAV4BIE9_9GAST|nr:hypothetical protein PoB_004519600 [Plakobranchus ocellatus]